MRVLIASDFYRPFIGGAERQVQLLGGALADRGNDVDVATVWHTGLPERELEGGVTLHRLRSGLMEQSWFSGDPARHFHPPFPVPGIVQGLRALINERQPDVVHANGWIAYSCAAALEGRNTPLLISVRDYGYSCAVRSLMERDRRICSGPALAKCLHCAAHRYGIPKALAAVGGVFTGRPLLVRHVRAFHVVSHFVGTIVERDVIGDGDLGWTPRVVRIPDVTPPAEDRDPTAAGAGLTDGFPAEPFILFVGQLTRHKGIVWLMEAYAKLADPPPLVLIGTRWPDTPKEFPAGVSVIGEVPHEVVLEAWRRCLFGVVPSVWPDPLPGVVREAMSRGKPVIGAAVGGILDMIEDGQTGLLVTPNDIDGLASAMTRLLADARLRTRLGTAALKTVVPLTADTVASRFEELYAELDADRRIATA